MCVGYKYFNGFMDKKNLVVLCYASNTCYTTVVPLDENEQDVRVNIPKSCWSMVKTKRLYRIGEEMRHCDNGCRGGVIGIYDRTNINHLDYMVHHSGEATESESSASDD